MKKILAIIISGFCCLGVANAASFNCNKASTDAEKAICANPILSDLDEKLLVVFKKARDNAGNSAEFKKIARANLVTRDACKDDDCLERWFNNSISLYENMVEDDDSNAFSEYPKEIQDVCKNLEITVNANNCNAAILEFEDKILNENYKAAMAAKKTDKERQELRDFQRQWIKDRDKYCKEELASGGTISNLNYMGCLIEWTKTRSIQLERAAEEF